MKEGKGNNGEKYSGFKEVRNLMVSSQIVSRGIKDKQVIAAMRTAGFRTLNLSLGTTAKTQQKLLSLQEGL